MANPIRICVPSAKDIVDSVNMGPPRPPRRVLGIRIKFDNVDGMWYVHVLLEGKGQTYRPITRFPTHMEALTAAGELIEDGYRGN